MTNEKMSIHKALCELKTLDSRIQKSISDATYVFANKHANARVAGMTVSDFCNEMKSNYQSAQDLIARREAIKRAVVMSNATSKVTIGDKEYSVAEAIEMKNHGIQFLQLLLRKLEKDQRTARRESDENNGDVLERRADSYISNLYGNTDMKTASAEIKKVREDFIVSQTYEIIDPLGVKGEMEKLEKEINTFMVDIDSALSVSNAITEVEISY